MRQFVLIYQSAALPFNLFPLLSPEQVGEGDLNIALRAVMDF